MKSFLKQLYFYINYKWTRRDHLNAVMLGKLLTEANKSKGLVNDFEEIEFRAFSQFGEDGIIQYLISHIDIPNKIFIEFGVENYLEANTRFLLINNNWKGLVIDGSKQAIDFIKKDNYAYLQTDLHVACNFITRDNINTIINSFTQIKDIGILSVDIDGNDYWVLEKIEAVKPIILICEYNSNFGKDLSISVPYKDDFVRQKESSTYVYFGASLKAMVELAEKKGYDFVGCNSHGVNAFFIRKDIKHPFTILTVQEGYRKPSHKELRLEDGQIVPLTQDNLKKVYKGLPFWNFTTNTQMQGEDIFA